MSTGTTLYYPFIHPRKTDHLKAALIYWDRVRRIVPNSVTYGDYAMDDDDDLKRLADNKLLVATRPEPYEDSASTVFFQHLQPQADRFRIDLETARSMASRNRGIHIEKLGYGVLGKLHSLGLAHQFGDWVTMHDEVGAFYMLCLASEMADKMSAPLFTDSPADAETGQALLFAPEAGQQVSEILLRLGIQLPSPEQLHDTPLEEIVQFADRRKSERLQFRMAVEGIVTAATAHADSNAFNDYLSTQRTTIETAVKNLRLTLDELGVGAISGTAKITVPAGMAAALAALPISHEASAILAALGLIIGGISCYAETRGKLRQARASTPYHYLLAIHDDLGIRAENFPD